MHPHDTKTPTVRGKRPPIINQDGTATVPLTRGMVAVIDAADAEIVGRHTWRAVENRPGKFYVRARMGDGALEYLHRFISGAPKGVDVDHIDGDRLNNRRCNLREATKSENAANTTRKRNNRSGYKGVCWRADAGKWQAQITADGKHRHLGYFSDAEDAARAYDAAAIEQWGEYAHTNFIT